MYICLGQLNIQVTPTWISLNQILNSICPNIEKNGICASHVLANVSKF